MSENKPMSQDNEQELEKITLTDENGVESEFVIIGSVEMKGTTYYAFVPADDVDSEYLEYGILKSVVEDGEEMLVTIDDDDEFDCDGDCINCDEECDLDEDFFEVECPSCGDTICFDGTIDPEELVCPSCGEKFECLVAEEDIAAIDQ